MANNGSSLLVGRCINLTLARRWNLGSCLWPSGAHCTVIANENPQIRDLSLNLLFHGSEVHPEPSMASKTQKLPFIQHRYTLLLLLLLLLSYQP